MSKEITVVSRPRVLDFFSTVFDVSPCRTQLHFVRCIKPNGQQQPTTFDSPLTLHQLRCCGVLEVARIARAGYPTRYLHTDFAERYRLLLPDLAPGPLPKGVTPLDVCHRLLTHFGVDPGLYQVGRTKLFFRAGVLGQLEDRAARVARSVLTLQSSWRMLCCRREFLRARAAAIKVQATWRGHEARKEYLELRRRSKAAVTIQAVFRMHMALVRYRRAQAAALAIQMGWRRSQFDRRVSVRVQQRLAAEAELAAEAARLAAIQEAEAAAVRAEQESYDALKSEFGVDGARVREILTIWQQHGAEFEEFLAWKAGGGAAVSAAALTAATAATVAAEAKVADLEEKLAAYSELKTYAEQLEEEANELREENMVLMEQRAAQLEAEAAAKSLPGVISVVAVAGAGDEDGQQEYGTPIPETGRHSLATDDTVSIMSYSDGEGGSPMARSSAKRKGPVSFGRAGPAGAVAALNAELDKKAALFDDDAAFICEVHEGVSAAPSMDPEAEIQRLLLRYKLWQKDFKTRLKSTQQSLKKFHSPAGSVAPPSATKPSDGSLTARLMTFARGPKSAGPKSSLGLAR